MAKEKLSRCQMRRNPILKKQQRVPRRVTSSQVKRPPKRQLASPMSSKKKRSRKSKLVKTMNPRRLAKSTNEFVIVYQGM